MSQNPIPEAAAGGAEVVDFDEVLLAACAPDERAELMTEADMLASALPSAGRGQQLKALADRLTVGESEPQSRPRARKLAAALRHLAREWEG